MAMSEAGHYGERGGSFPMNEDFGSTALDAHNADAEPQLHKTTHNPSTTTEHDFRFPRRPTKAPQGQPQSSMTLGLRGGGDGATQGATDKLGITSVDTMKRKELLRDTFFATWKDDAAGVEDDSPEALQKKDPLATQIWKLYCRTKKQLPNQERMENLTWRMMAMNLRKRREEDAARYAAYTLGKYGAKVANSMMTARRSRH
jgi:GATA-binding protein